MKTSSVVMAKVNQSIARNSRGGVGGGPTGAVAAGLAGALVVDRVPEDGRFLAPVLWVAATGFLLFVFIQQQKFSNGT